MANNPPTRSRVATIALASGLAALALASVGCEQPLAEGQTYHKLHAAWPLFDVEKWEGVNEDGTTWKKERGDACCWLATWEKEKKYDKNGFQIYSKERSGFFPLFSNEKEESEEFTLKNGMFLFSPYESYRKKGQNN